MRLDEEDYGDRAAWSGDGFSTGAIVCRRYCLTTPYPPANRLSGFFLLVDELARARKE